MIDWKAGERKIASILGAERIPVNGRRGTNRPSDVVSGWIVAEVKTTKHFPVFLAKAMAQAIAGAAFHERKDGKARLPVVVIHGDGDLYSDALVGIRLGDFVDHFGGAEEAAKIDGLQN